MPVPHKRHTYLKSDLIHCRAAGHALIQQLIGPVEQAVVLVPEIEGLRTASMAVNQPQQ